MRTYTDTLFVCLFVSHQRTQAPHRTHVNVVVEALAGDGRRGIHTAAALDTGIVVDTTHKLAVSTFHSKTPPYIN